MARRRELHDAYFRKAKAEGYAARSAYKLRQIDERKRILPRGGRVLDLGCAPGSWLQVAAEIVGPTGAVAGLDLQPVTATLPPNVRTAVGDVFTTPAEDLLALAADPGHPGPPRLYDTVLSDMAPSTSGGGGGSADHFRSVDLCRRVLALLPALLRPGGNLAMKVFEGEAYPDLLRETAALFNEAKGFKPDASRDVSREIYIVAKGFRPPAAPREAPAAGASPAIAPPAPKGWGR
jgi:23S rRNA (uridine2552-2'-O)-methyltransferase